MQINILNYLAGLGCIISQRQSQTKTLAERVRKKRLEKGWTQGQLAALVGTSQSVIQKIENGRSLRPRKLDEIATVLNVSLCWLTSGEGSEMDSETTEIARVWAQLPEPYRSKIWAKIQYYSEVAKAS